jgi:hypothetical protein
MKKNQKIFACYGADGKLTGKFVAVLNGKRSGIDGIRKGYENVLESRLKDARYFYKADTKEPFEKKLQLEGIGYKVDVKGDKLVMALGFSHPVEVPIPAGLKVTIEKNIITISGIDKEKVGQFTSRIRDLKKPEPYKGKGLRYQGEVIKIKQGKKSA